MLKAEGLEYETTGTGEPLLLIHGSHIAGSFLPFVGDSDLTDRYRLIRYHRRGFAGSDAISAPFSIEQQAQDAKALLAHLGIERAHVAGHSYGALTALQLALDAPDAVQSLVLLEPPLTTPESAADFANVMGPIMQAYYSGDARGAVDSFMSMACGPDWRTEAEAAVPGAPQQADDDASTFFEVEIPALGEWAFDQDVATRITQPALFVLGSESGPVFEGAQKLFASFVPHSKDVVLPGLNHLLHMRDHKAVAAAIVEFLAEHPLAASRT